MDYYKILKELQLDGTLNKIKEDIRLFDEEQFKQRNENQDVELVCIHFIDKVLEHMKVDVKYIEQVNYAHYDLSINDEEFMASVKVYTDERARLKKIKDDKWVKETKALIEKTPKETLDTLRDLFDKYDDLFDF